jgi:hypothetical protein
LAHAEHAKHESQHHFKLHQILSYAAAFFSVAVVFSMIAMSLAGWGTVLFGMSVLFGVLGAALTAYPFLLLH